MSGYYAVRTSRARRVLISQLKRGGATSDAGAIPLVPEGRFEHKMLARMIRREVIRPGSRGGYWLDLERYADWRRQQVLFLVGSLLVTFGLMACILLNVPEHPDHARGAAADSADSVRENPVR